MRPHLQAAFVTALLAGSKLVEDRELAVFSVHLASHTHQRMALRLLVCRRLEHRCAKATTNKGIEITARPSECDPTDLAIATLPNLALGRLECHQYQYPTEPTLERRNGSARTNAVRARPKMCFLLFYLSFVASRGEAILDELTASPVVERPNPCQFGATPRCAHLTGIASIFIIPTRTLLHQCLHSVCLASFTFRCVRVDAG